METVPYGPRDLASVALESSNAAASGCKFRCILTFVVCFSILRSYFVKSLDFKEHECCSKF